MQLLINNMLIGSRKGHTPLSCDFEVGAYKLVVPPARLYHACQTRSRSPVIVDSKMTTTTTIDCKIVLAYVCQVQYVQKTVDTLG